MPRGRGESDSFMRGYNRYFIRSLNKGLRLNLLFKNIEYYRCRKKGYIFIYYIEPQTGRINIIKDIPQT